MHRVLSRPFAETAAAALRGTLTVTQTAKGAETTSQATVVEKGQSIATSQPWRHVRILERLVPVAGKSFELLQRAGWLIKRGGRDGKK